MYVCFDPPSSPQFRTTNARSASKEVFEKLRKIEVKYRDYIDTETLQKRTTTMSTKKEVKRLVVLRDKKVY